MILSPNDQELATFGGMTNKDTFIKFLNEGYKKFLILNQSIDSSKNIDLNNYSVNWFRLNLDPSNHDIVRALQEFLGIKVDGIFGYKTQELWFKAVNEENNSIYE